MGSFESKSLTPQEQMKIYKKEITRSIRELDKERVKLERQNEKLKVEMKKVVAGNQERILRQYAKDYVRAQRQIENFYTMRTHLMGVELTLQTAKSQDALGNAVKNATRAMQQMGRRMNNPAMMSIMRGFADASAQMNDTQDELSEQVDAVMGENDDVGEENDIVNAVMEEMRQGLVKVGSKAPTEVAAPPAAIATAEMSGGGGGGGRPPPPPGAGGGTGAGAGGGAGAGTGGGGGSGGGGGGAVAAALEARLAAVMKQ